MNYFIFVEISFDRVFYRNVGKYYDSMFVFFLENFCFWRCMKKKLDNFVDVIKYEDIVIRNDLIFSLVGMLEF